MSDTRTVKLEDIKALLDNSNTEETSFHGKEVLVSYELKDRGLFTITGRGAVVDKQKFNYDVGLEFARKDAENQLLRLEGYLAQLVKEGVVKFISKENE